MGDDRDRFSGDMSRNEVEIDLKKFMEMVTENNDLKREIFELTNDERKNPWQKWVFAAKTIDAWRIIPRLFLGIYMYLLYYASFWFMDLAAWFGLYTSSAAKEHGDTNPN